MVIQMNKNTLNRVRSVKWTKIFFAEKGQPDEQNYTLSWVRSVKWTKLHFKLGKVSQLNKNFE